MNKLSDVCDLRYFDVLLLTRRHPHTKMFTRTQFFTRSSTGYKPEIA